LEKARAIIAARLASKDSSAANPALPSDGTNVNAMSLIARGYESDSEQEEGEIEYNKVKQMAKKAKLQSVIEAVEDASRLSAAASVPQVGDYSTQNAMASLPVDIQSTDNYNRSQSGKIESRSGDDHRSHRSKDSSRDRRDHDQRDSSTSDRDKIRRDSKHSRQDSRPSGDEKVSNSNSQGENDRHPSHISQEGETSTEVIHRSEGERCTSNKDDKDDGHRQHSSKLQETSAHREADRPSESEKRRSDRRRSRSNTRQTSPDGRHRSSQTNDKRPER